MQAALAWLILSAGIPGVPRLVDRGAVAVQAQWKHVKEAVDPVEQRRRIAADRLDRVRCRDVVDLGELRNHSPIALWRRDFVRNRLAARPELFAVVAGATRLLARDHPKAAITIGDVAQPGCGQLRWGVVVDFVPSSEADGALEWPIAFGAPTRWVAHAPDDFMDEYPRFHETLGPVYVEDRVTGRTADGTLRMERRRFDGGQRLDDGSVTRLLDRTRKRLRDRAHVTWGTTKHTVAGKRVTVRTATWAHPKEKRWMEAVFTTRRGKRARRGTLLRVREARLDRKKPTSRKGEERYIFGWDDEAGVAVIRHRLQYEAHHTSHVGGFDADLSYVTFLNRGHFAPAVAALDPFGSFAWMKALHESARRLDVPLLALFADRSVLNVLRVADPKKKHPVWRKLKRSAGHDSHVHVRVGRSPRLAGLDRRQILERIRAW